MKNYILLLFVVLASLQTFGQRRQKEDAAAKTDSIAKDTVAAQAQVVDSSEAIGQVPKDTLTKATDSPVAAPVTQKDSLTIANDSLSKELSAYRVLYTAIKEKVIKHDFDPIRMSQIIDSLAANRDSTFSRLSSSSVFLKDTVAMLKKEIAKLNERINGLTAEDAATNRIIIELKLLKELLDSGILTQSEFDIKKTMVLEKW